MAIYHLSVKAVSRSTGRSAVAAAAYRTAERLTNERDGITHDYSRRSGVEDAFIVAPDGAGWAHDRSALWNAAEAAEKRKDAKVAREYEVALPAELSAEERRDLARAFAAAVVERYGVAADVAIHAPGKAGDQQNHHAHILTTTRTVGAEGLGVKTRQLDQANTASVEVEHLRAVWAGMTNQALERAGLGERVSHLSHKARGLEQTPTIHVGVAAMVMERKAEARAEKLGIPHEPVTDRVRQNQAIVERNRMLVAARTAVRNAQEALKGFLQEKLDQVQKVKREMLELKLTLRPRGPRL